LSARVFLSDSYDCPPFLFHWIKPDSIALQPFCPPRRLSCVSVPLITRLELSQQSDPSTTHRVPLPLAYDDVLVSPVLPSLLPPQKFDAELQFGNDLSPSLRDCQSAAVFSFCKLVCKCLFFVPQAALRGKKILPSIDHIHSVIGFPFFFLLVTRSADESQFLRSPPGFCPSPTKFFCRSPPHRPPPFIGQSVEPASFVQIDLTGSCCCSPSQSCHASLFIVHLCLSRVFTDNFTGSLPLRFAPKF